MARTAAKRRAKDEGTGKVVIHPVAIKYIFHGDLEKEVDPTLDANREATDVDLTRR